MVMEIQVPKPGINQPSLNNCAWNLCWMVPEPWKATEATTKIILPGKYIINWRILKNVYIISMAKFTGRGSLSLCGDRKSNSGVFLSNLDLNYTLFEPDGTPLRVKVNATFLEHKSREQLLAESRASSPDLTHYRKVKQGDRLDSLTNKIYNDSKYFMQVGKVNNLTTIGKVKPGSELYFPPFDKNEI